MNAGFSSKSSPSLLSDVIASFLHSFFISEHDEGGGDDEGGGGDDEDGGGDKKSSSGQM